MGDLSVSVTVDDNNITGVKIDGPGETPDIGGKAIPTLEANAKAKGAALDGVAGATITSDAVRDAVAEALKKATR